MHFPRSLNSGAVQSIATANPDTHCERLVTFVRLSQVRKQEIRQKERRQMVDLPARGIIGGGHHATWDQGEERRRVISQRSRAEHRMMWHHTLRSMNNKGTYRRQLVPGGRDDRDCREQHLASTPVLTHYDARVRKKLSAARVLTGRNNR